jgi:trehalose 6-phosphate phosphatase
VETIDEAVALLARDPQRTGLLLDFDGSLSPIVERPDEARPLPGTAEVLSVLARRLAVVAIVSGRPVDFLIEHVAAPGVQLVGQYGFERLIGDEIVVDPRALAYTDAVAAVAAEAEARWPALLIERKGRIAVGVHWRTAPEVGEAAVGDIEALAARHGLGVYPSKMARELRPPIELDKGDAVESLFGGVSVGAFAGDDSGDLPAFRALDRLQAEHRLEHTLRIAVSSPEAPAEVLVAGDIVVDGPAGLRVVLDALAAALA